MSLYLLSASNSLSSCEPMTRDLCSLKLSDSVFLMACCLWTIAVFSVALFMSFSILLSLRFYFINAF